MMATTQVQLFLREFDTLTEAHVLAGQMSLEPLAASIFWIDISATARGAWVLGKFAASAPMTTTEIERLAKKFGLALAVVDESVLNALLSLGPKPESSTEAVGIIEGADIAHVLRSADHFSKLGRQLLEIRIKRAGSQSGAYAYFALPSMTSPSQMVTSQVGLLAMTEVPLRGDYRRFFL